MSLLPSSMGVGHQVELEQAMLVNPVGLRLPMTIDVPMLVGARVDQIRFRSRFRCYDCCYCYDRDQRQAGSGSRRSGSEERQKLVERVCELHHRYLLRFVAFCHSCHTGTDHLVADRVRRQTMDRRAKQAPAETPSVSVMWNGLLDALVASMQNEVAEMYL